MKKIRFVMILAATVIITTLALGFQAYNEIYTIDLPASPHLDSSTIPKYVNQLVIPPVHEPTSVTTDKKGNVVSQNYTVTMSEFQQQILPETYPMTTVWGYGGKARTADGTVIEDFKNAPGATFETIKGVPITVKWVNNLTGSYMLPVDPTLDWANPNNLTNPDVFEAYPNLPPEFLNTVPVVPHLHGGETPSIYDGNPEAWFTANKAVTGSAFVTDEYTYLNSQTPATIWYHDHAMGLTRLNVYSGLAGFYLIRDTKNVADIEKKLPSGKYEIPLAIQDRSFYEDGSLRYNTEPNSSEHPYWSPEFFGDTIIVNGTTWPNLNVARGKYRFRVLNGSNARFYNLSLSNGQSFQQIGTDGGLLAKAVTMNTLLIAPGERADLIIDFSMAAPDDKIILKNNAVSPYSPDAQLAGAAEDIPDPDTVGQIMQFTVTNEIGFSNPLPNILNKITKLITNKATTRVLTLNEYMDEDGEPVVMLINGQPYKSKVTETPRVGATELWQIVNLTADTHPIHLHLVTFQLVSRQKIDVSYQNDWYTLNGMMPLMDKDTAILPLDPKYLLGTTLPPNPNEAGWKDTVQMNPGEVTTIAVRFAPQDSLFTRPGMNLFPFDPSAGPGYVWHCHLLDHEDNEMMRPLQILK